MKKLTLIITSMVMSALLLSSCEYQSPEEKIEGVVKDVQYLTAGSSNKSDKIVISFEDGRTIQLFNLKKGIIVKKGVNNKVYYHDEQIDSVKFDF